MSDHASARLTEAELEIQRRARHRDVQDGLTQGWCLKDLALKWGVSRPSVSQWCRKHIEPEDRKRLADNGTAMIGERLRTFDLRTRLEVIKVCRDAGWCWDKIGIALGVSGHSLWSLAQRHAPHGLAEAIEDFRDDDQSQAA